MATASSKRPTPAAPQGRQRRFGALTALRRGRPPADLSPTLPTLASMRTSHSDLLARSSATSVGISLGQPSQNWQAGSRWRFAEAGLGPIGKLRG